MNNQYRLRLAEIAFVTVLLVLSCRVNADSRVTDHIGDIEVIAANDVALARFAVVSGSEAKITIAMRYWTISKPPGIGVFST